MRSTSRSHWLGAGVLALAGLLSFAASAQESSEDVPRISQSDVMVSIMADGGEVRAAGATVLIQGQALDIRAAGASVASRANARGDVMLAGAQVQVSGEIGGDLSVAGANVEVRGSIARDARVAGAVAFINAAVAGDAYVGAATVNVGGGSDIAGDLKAAGANLTISGHVGGQVDASGGLVTLNARTDGSVIARAAQVIVNAPARIAGDLAVYSLNEPVVAEGAVITGTVTRIAPPSWWDQWTGTNWWWWKISLALLIALGTILAGLVLLLFASRVFVGATDNVRQRPLSSLLFGILTFVVVPFVAIVLFATVVGISVGFAVLLVLPILVVFGHAIAAAGLAAGLLVRRHGDLGSGVGFLMLVAGAIILGAIGLVPYVGPLLVVIAIVLGTGATARALGARIRQGPSAAPV